MTHFKPIFTFLSILLISAASAQQVDPHIGYVYPAGGRQGTSFDVIIGGMNLNSVEKVTISGKGASCISVKRFAPFKHMSNDAKRELMPILRAISAGEDPLEASKKNSEKILKRLKRLKEKNDKLKAESEKKVEINKNKEAEKEKKTESKKGPYKPSIEEQLRIIPGERLIYIDMTPEEVIKKIKSLSEIEYSCLVKTVFGRKSALQATPALDQIAIAHIKIDKKAEPGIREFRLFAKNGESNPLRFVVGKLPETRGRAFTPDNKNLPIEITLPITVNGQIMPGEIDKFIFNADAGKQYSIEVMGRKLIPFLGDAVPGWLQAVISVVDENGNVVAFADDNYFDPDPVLEFTPQKDGKYQLRIRDSIYRGREDFVYRVTLQEGSLKHSSLKPMQLRHKLKKVDESETNDTIDTPQKIVFPAIISGTVNRAGDVDIFSFDVEKGEKIAIETIARRDGSPLDSKIYLMNSEGKVLAWNDDYKWGNIGTETHHADSFLLYTPKETGSYYIKVEDALRHGGSNYFYRLRVDKARPTFSVYATPSSLSMKSGMSIPVTFHIFRYDGFDDDIKIKISKAPKGVFFEGCRIKKGIDKARMTVSVSDKTKPGTYKIGFTGEAVVDGKKITVPVIPAEDIMQAFLWRHIVPAEDMTLDITRRGWSMVQAKTKQVEVSPGDECKIVWINRAYKSKKQRDVVLELDQPPKGISIVKTTRDGQEYISELAVSEDAKTWSGNLIFKLTINGINAKNKKKSRYFVGYLPAVHCEIRKK